MKKNPLLLLLLFSFAFVVSSCKKDDEPAPPPPVVGRWVLDRVALSSFPAPFQALNREFAPTVFGYESTYTLLADKKFNFRFSDGVEVLSGGGTWEYTGTTLTLRSDDGTEEILNYEQPRTGVQELRGERFRFGLELPNPTTGVDEQTSGQAQFVYSKQP